MTTLDDIVVNPPVYIGNEEYFQKVRQVFDKCSYWSLNDLEKELVKTRYGDYPYINRGIMFLRYIGLILGNDNKLYFTDRLESVDILSEVVLCRLLNQLHKTNEFINVFPVNSVYYDSAIDSICLNRNYMPFKYAPIWNMIENLLSNAQNSDNSKKIYISTSNTITELFSLNYKEKNHLISFMQLEEKLEAQRIAGYKAEKVVLEYEKERLKSRKSLIGLQIISNYNVGAGYDINSYNDIESTEIDRFIEVKSYIGNIPQFYWSRNEVKAARKYGRKYYIYLVDRDQMYDYDYQPIIIDNPLRTILHNNQWHISPDGFFCQLYNE